MDRLNTPLCFDCCFSSISASPKRPSLLRKRAVARSEEEIQRRQRSICSCRRRRRPAFSFDVGLLLPSGQELVFIQKGRCALSMTHFRRPRLLPCRRRIWWWARRRWQLFAEISLKEPFVDVFHGQGDRLSVNCEISDYHQRVFRAALRWHVWCHGKWRQRSATTTNGFQSLPLQQLVNTVMHLLLPCGVGVGLQRSSTSKRLSNRSAFLPRFWPSRQQKFPFVASNVV